MHGIELPLTGIDVVDDQHREMLAEIAKLQDANQIGRGGTHLEEVIIFLADYVQTHFAFEEFVMKGSRYPGLEAHRASHAAFVGRFGEIRRRFHEATMAGEDVTELSEQTAEWLRSWLTAHITSEDAAMAEYLREQP